jgi:transcriptional regulator with XRE-family HTH domain
MTQAEEITLKKLVGQRIKDAREVAGVKQEVLSSYLGFKSRISISNIESGRQNIQLTTLVEIADYLRVPITSLIPPLETIKTTVNRKLVRNIGKDGIANSNSRERILDFIRFTATKK